MEVDYYRRVEQEVRAKFGKLLPPGPAFRYYFSCDSADDIDTVVDVCAHYIRTK